MHCLSVNGQNLCVFTSTLIKENAYLLVKGRKALIVDPNDSPDLLAFLRKTRVQEITIFLTHEHFDHTCGIPSLQTHFQTTLVCSYGCAEVIADEKNNQAKWIYYLLICQDEQNGTHLAESFQGKDSKYALIPDHSFKEQLDYPWEGEHFHFQVTPGHSAGSCCIVWNDAAVFTGDSLLADRAVITRFPNGSTKQYHRRTKPYLDSLPDDLLILPGHGDCCVMRELRKETA